MQFCTAGGQDGILRGDGKILKLNWRNVYLQQVNFMVYILYLNKGEGGGVHEGTERSA